MFCGRLFLKKKSYCKLGMMCSRLCQVGIQGKKRGGKEISDPGLSPAPDRERNQNEQFIPIPLGIGFLSSLESWYDLLVNGVEEFSLGSQKLFAGFPKPTGRIPKVVASEPGDRLESYPEHVSRFTNERREGRLGSLRGHEKVARNLP